MIYIEHYNDSDVFAPIYDAFSGKGELYMHVFFVFNGFCQKVEISLPSKHLSHIKRIIPKGYFLYTGYTRFLIFN